jgi:hypothetical protein
MPAPDPVDHPQLFSYKDTLTGRIIVVIVKADANGSKKGASSAISLTRQTPAKEPRLAFLHPTNSTTVSASSMHGNVTLFLRYKVSSSDIAMSRYSKS